MSDSSETQEIIDLARRAVEFFIRQGCLLDVPSALPATLHRPAACFVSIKTNAGDLRGCIGTIEPVHKTLAEEIIANAASAATRDPRFPPIEAAELFSLRYSVDVLSNPASARLEEFDPKIYGVIVEDEMGLRRGLLLPDLEGITTVDQQIAVAARKAGILPTEPIRLFRFRVERFRAD